VTPSSLGEASKGEDICEVFSDGRAWLFFTRKLEKLKLERRFLKKLFFVPGFSFCFTT